MQNTVIKQLETLGLSQKEAACYAALLKVKKGTALTVAAAAGIKRPTAYQVLKELHRKKLVAITKFREVLDYRALPLEHLKHYVGEQRRLAERELPAIEKLYNAREHKLRLRVYSSVGHAKTLLEKSLREKSALHVFGSEATLSLALGAYWDFYLKRSRQLSIAPQFKPVTGPVIIGLWSDKVLFADLGDAPQVFGFKNKALHDMYQDVWNNY